MAHRRGHRGRSTRSGRSNTARGNTAGRQRVRETEIALSNQGLSQRQAESANIDRLRGISQSPTTRKTDITPTTQSSSSGGSLFGGGSAPKAGATEDTFNVDGKPVSKEEFDRVLEERNKPVESTPEEKALGQAIRDLEELGELAGGDGPLSEFEPNELQRLEDFLPGVGSLADRDLSKDQLDNVRDFLKKQQTLDSPEALEQERIDAVISGDAEDIIQTSQETLRKKQLDRSIAEQTEAEVVAQRALFREQQQATLLGQELDRSESALKRQQDAITRGLDAQSREFNAAQGQIGLQEGAIGREQEGIARGLAAEERQFGEATAEIGRQRDLLGRTEAGIRRQGSLAARAGQVQQAAAANIAAQSGFASSSALQGSASSAGSVAATASGDVLTGLVATGVERGRIAGSEGLLNAAFSDAQAGAASAQAGLTDRLASLATQGDLLTSAFGDIQAEASAARAGIADDFGRLGSERFKLGTHAEDIAFEQQRLRDQLEGNVGFLQDTFTLGGSISEAGATIASQQSSKAERDAQRQAVLSGISTGAAIGANFGPVGAGVGAGIGAVVGLFG